MREVDVTDLQIGDLVQYRAGLVYVEGIVVDFVKDEQVSWAQSADCVYVEVTRRFFGTDLHKHDIGTRLRIIQHLVRKHPRQILVDKFK